MQWAVCPDDAFPFLVKSFYCGDSSWYRWSQLASITPRATHMSLQSLFNSFCWFLKLFFFPVWYCLPFIIPIHFLGFNLPPGGLLILTYSDEISFQKLTYYRFSNSAWLTVLLKSRVKAYILQLKCYTLWVLVNPVFLYSIHNNLTSLRSIQISLFLYHTFIPGCVEFRE